MLKNRLVAAPYVAMLVSLPLAEAAPPADHWVREALQGMATATTAGTVRKAVGGLPATLKKKLASATLEADLQVEAVLEALASADDNAVRAFARKAGVRCGSLAPSQRDTEGTYLRKVGACLLEAAQQSVGGGSHAAVGTALQRVVSAAGLGARALRKTLDREAAQLRRDAPRAAGLFPEALTAAVGAMTGAEAGRFREFASGCVKLRHEKGEDLAGYATRVGSCLQGAATAATAATRVGEIREAVKSLVGDAARGLEALKGAIERAARRLKAPVTRRALFPEAVEKALGKADANRARAFAQAARGCGGLPLIEAEDLGAFVARVAACLVEATEVLDREPAEKVVRRSLHALAKAAQKGAGALRKAFEAALQQLPRHVGANLLFPTALRQALLQPTRTLAGVLVRTTRRCGDIVRGPNEKRKAFVRRVGQCLAKGAAEALPENVAAAVLEAVKGLVDAARRGVAPLRKAASEVRRALQGKADPARVFTGVVLGQIQKADAAWARRFARLGAVCGKRKFKKHHNLPEFFARTSLCLEAAALGITEKDIEAMMRGAVRAVAAAARKGARDLRMALRGEVARLERRMRVADLFPKDWRRTVEKLPDASARAFGEGAARCADARAKKPGLGKLARALSACLLSAVGGSGTRALVQRVEAAVKLLTASARAGAAVLRVSLPRAVAALRGLVSASRLFPPPLRTAIAHADGALASALAKGAPTCADDARPEGARFDRYLQQVANCLVRIATRAGDERRLATIRAALEELAVLASGGPAKLLGGFRAWRARQAGPMRLPADLVAALTHTIRTDALATRLRNQCAKLPASTPTEARKVRDCVTRAVSHASKLEPPDACRGKTAGDLFECCMTGTNRALPSCAPHRFSCRMGEVFRAGGCQKVICPAGMVAAAGGQCVRPPCPAGHSRDAAGNCIAVCPAGTARNAFGQCEQLVCATPGAMLDTQGRCVATVCPAGTQPDAMRRCLSPGCPLRMARNASGFCAPIACPPGSTIDGLGRCQQISCPVGMAFDTLRRCVWTWASAGPVGQLACTEPGAMLDRATNRCVVASCPEGTTADPWKRCVGAGCPPGQIRNAAGQCEPAACPGSATLDPLGRCVEFSCPTGLTFDPTGSRCVPGG